MHAFPPLSLSTYWKNADQVCLVDVPSRTSDCSQNNLKSTPVTDNNNENGGDECGNDSMIGKDEIPLLPHPELEYLSNIRDNLHGSPHVNFDNFTDDLYPSPNSKNNDSNCINSHDSAMAVNLLDHDPLGVIQRLSDVVECLALAIPPSDRHVLLSVGLALGAKSGRAALLLGAASVLASSESVLNDNDIDVKVLHDLRAFIKSKESGIPDDEDGKCDEQGEDNGNVLCKERGIEHSSDEDACHLLKDSLLR